MSEISLIDQYLGLKKTSSDEEPPCYELTFDLGQYSRAGATGGDRYCDIIINLIIFSIPDDGLVSVRAIVPLDNGDTLDEVVWWGIDKKATIRNIVKLVTGMYQSHPNLWDHENKEFADSPITVEAYLSRHFSSLVSSSQSFDRHPNYCH